MHAHRVLCQTSNYTAIRQECNYLLKTICFIDLLGLRSSSRRALSS